MRPLRVHFLPELVRPEELAKANALLFDAEQQINVEATCVVIDVLRATTTIVTALAAGATAVWPYSSVEEAFARAIELRAIGFSPPGPMRFLKRFLAASRSSTIPTVLGGERRGLKIEGFDLGNSPAEYTSSSVGEKAVVLTTTNGTKALLHARRTKQILIGAFVNLTAICARVAASMNVDLLCAGTDGGITREDVLFAGAVVARLMADQTWTPDDQALIARDAWLQVAGGREGGDLKASLVAAMRASRGGRNLIDIGMEADIELAADIDRFNIAPQFNPKAGKITV